MDFVFMLTRNDATVENALDLVEVAGSLQVSHIGFKDVGAEPKFLKRLTAAIREAGAAVWMEVVSTARDDELASIALARDLGVDWLMGGVHAEEALRVLKGSQVQYLPFPGKPMGRPTRLNGTPAEIEAHCRAFMGLGCAGVDLLAYRAEEAEPIDLVLACRRGLGERGRLIVAGSIDRRERIAAIRAAGADAFTIGAAALDSTYSPGAGPLAAQLSAILSDCAGRSEK